MYVLIVIFVSIGGTLTAKTAPMTFDNPGTKRLLKSEAGNYYFYRSLPEKTMQLNVKNLDKIEVRAFSTKSIAKPKVIVIIGKQKTSYDLILDKTLNKYTLYQSISVAVPKGTESIEILCYDRSIYLRSFYTVAPKPKPVKLPNLKILAHGGMMSLAYEKKASSYYTCDSEHQMKFEVNNKRNAIMYVRAKLTDRSIPTFDLYQDGKMIKRYQLPTKRTSKYKVAGITHLSTGMRIDLPANSGSSVFELKSISGHLILVKPVIKK